ncbi:MAG TPA: Ig domain-containing protein, partial [Jatrophihabitans sp.]|nr:Ig domain-containing protein [Jatrophihabitans sp.]
MPLLHRRTEAASDDGFILLESIISISLIVIVMAGLTNFFVTITSVTSQFRARQSAVMYADNTVDRIRAMQPTDTTIGRSATAVASEFAAAPAQVATLLTQVSQVSDNSGATAKLPMTSSQTINGTVYTATNYIGSCSLPLLAANGTACTISYAGTIPVAAFLRVVVAVSWPSPHCGHNTCVYVTDTLLSTDSDPNFLLNQTPPAAPVIVDPGAQTSAINDAINLQPTLTSPAVVAPVTWSSTVNGTDTLPDGLSINSATGLIAGSPTGPVSNGVSVTLTATDAFGRSDTDTFSWKILADLVPSGLGATAQGPVNTAIATITLSATGGSGTGYSWSVPAAGQPGSLPTGLSL